MKTKNALCGLAMAVVLQLGTPALLMLVLAGGATASAQVVTNSADSGPGTLRSAIANAANGAAITFAPSLSGATITLSNTLTINTNLTIDASALPGGLQINGNGSVQIFNVASSITVFLNSLTITNGYTATNSAIVYVGGGGIDNSGILTLNNCTLSGNSAYNTSPGGGGGIFNAGTLTLNQCTLSGNSATNGGGGIYNNGTLTLTNCTLSENSATNEGGGIFNKASLTMSQCTLSGNSAGIGGGIYNPGPGGGIATLNQCTLSGNSAYNTSPGGGGGIFNAFGTLALNQCTLSGNSGLPNNAGGGIYNDLGALVMTNTVVGGNSGGSPADIFNHGGLTYGGSNLVQSVNNAGGTITGPAPLTNAPDLAPLGNYGGPTQTMPPLPGSPAIDAGSNAATNDFATDQRGLPRFVGPQVDIGAVEFQASPVVTNADSGPGSLRYAIEYVTNNATITFDPSLSGATITLSNTLTINTNLTIDASALPGGLQINGNHAVQIFNVAFNITVFLNSLTITNGYSTINGGGIYNNGTLTLTNCILSGNSAHSGGGIDNLRTLTLNQCTLSGNSASDYGGGIYNFLNGTLALNQCTLSGNSAHSGGGISNVGTLTLNQCTLSGNSATEGGGIDNYYDGRLAMTNTIVAGNSGSPGADIYGYEYPLIYGGSNLVQSVDNSGGSYGPAPLTSAPDLAPLGNYGGPTQTMPPLPGSPAIDAGSVAANTFSTDQRGYPRTQNGLIDLGAVELQPPAANPPVLENLTVPAGGGSGLQFTFTNAPGADFTVLTATNVSLALTNWTVLGEVQQVAPGQYQFTDPQAATNRARFYRVRSP